MSTTPDHAQNTMILDWQSPAAQAVLGWEQAALDEAVANVFGFHALQLGNAPVDALRNNRIAHRWLAAPEVLPQSPELPPSTHADALEAAASRPTARHPQLYCRSEALPFAESSLDLLVLPHTLEHSLDAHASLREVQRVLVPEGHVVLTGFEPYSWWGVRHGVAKGLNRLGLSKSNPLSVSADHGTHMIALWRLQDWLQLLNLEVKTVQRSSLWRQSKAKPVGKAAVAVRRLAWGSAYMVVAVKKTVGVRWINPVWTHVKAAPQVQPAASSTSVTSLHPTQKLQLKDL